MRVEQKARLYTDILSHVLQKRCKGNIRLGLKGYGAKHLTLCARLSDPSDQKSILSSGEDFALAARIKHCIVQRQNGLIYFQVQLPEIYQKELTRQDIVKKNLPSDTIALAEGWTGVQYDFPTYAPHGLFAGTTGSGKTEAIKSAIVGLAQTYTPTQLRFLIVDGKKIDYGADFNNMAHLSMPIAKDFNSYSTVINYAYSEMIERYRLLSTDSMYKTPYKIVLVIDEIHDSEIIGVPSNYEAIKNIAKKGRAADIHLIAGTQKPSQKGLPEILDLLLNRFIGLVSDPNISFQLTGKKQLGAHLLAGEGDMLHVMGAKAERCQICRTTEADYRSLPRAEIIEPELDLNRVYVPDDIILDKPKPGKPENKIETMALAYYEYHYPNFPTVEQAKAEGISYGKHKMHIDFLLSLFRDRKQLSLNGGRITR